MLDALCYNLGDRIVLTDDIPGNNTISCLVEAMTNGWWRDNVHRYGAAGLVLSINPRALIRYQDGSASGLYGGEQGRTIFSLSVPHLSEFDDPMRVDLSSATIEPIRLVFCGYNAPRLRRHCRGDRAAV